MVILLSALAVVAAAICLVAWFVVGGGFALIYAAMALAVVSMLLLWAARWVGSTTEPDAPLAPSPLADDLRVEVPARRGATTSEGPSGVGTFPIADYEHLWVTQILPLVPQLDDDELAVVEARERGGRHRGGILDAIDAERDRRRGGPRAAEPVVAPVLDEGAASDPDPAGAELDDLDGRLDESDPFARAWKALTEAEEASADDAARRAGLVLDPDPDLDHAPVEAAEGEVEVEVAEVDPQVEVEGEGGAEVEASVDDDDEGDEAAVAASPAPLIDRLRARADADRSPGPHDGAAPDDVVDLDDAAVEPDDEPADDPAELVGSAAGGAPRVRTFLGRVTAPITVDHGPGDGLP